VFERSDHQREVSSMAIPRPRADVSWVSHFAASYATWLQKAGSLLEAHQYAEAFKTYPWPMFAHAPWSPVRTPFGGPRLGVVTTAGSNTGEVRRESRRSERDTGR
jgi:hypothetical protein